MTTSKQAWWFGAFGLAGALLLAIGDQCLYFATVSGADFARNLRTIVATAPTARALAGAGLAPVAALLYLAGFAHVYAHIRSRQPRLAVLVGIGLALCILAGASYHVLWGARALAIKASGATPALAILEAQLRDFAANVYLIAELAGYPAVMLLGVLVVLGRSDYPRWFCMLTPAIPMLLLQFVTPWVPAPFGSLAGGSAVNLSFALFFAVSIALTGERGLKTVANEI